jgi:hypothetical protein
LAYVVEKLISCALTIFADESFFGYKPGINTHSGVPGAFESGDRGKSLVLRLVQIAAFLKPFNFPVKSQRGVFQQNRPKPASRPHAQATR